MLTYQPALIPTKGWLTGALLQPLSAPFEAREQNPDRDGRRLSLQTGCWLFSQVEADQDSVQI